MYMIRHDNHCMQLNLPSVPELTGLQNNVSLIGRQRTLLRQSESDEIRFAWSLDVWQVPSRMSLIVNGVKIAGWMLTPHRLKTGATLDLRHAECHRRAGATRQLLAQLQGCVGIHEVVVTHSSRRIRYLGGYQRWNHAGGLKVA
jgi:hypothetical protein